jgi:hypothetical protein
MADVLCTDILRRMHNLQIQVKKHKEAKYRIFCDEDARWEPRKENGGYYDKTKYAKGHLLVEMTHSS